MADDDETKISDTEEESDIFLEYINKNFPNWKCPICGFNKISYSPKANPITFPMVNMEKMEVLLAQGVPAYWVYCNNCFNISFFQKILVDNFQKIKNQEQTEDDKKQ
ncbi:hypothetical protein [Commensalibacter melissae]|uniref:hypothetical protein n=1 Tax=Commensalibacter melissae TaxID=2070537 RepID=UPI0012D9BFDF|nr:hypothetical protein [Commensalibacter melissae]MUG09403.1 hypothetical protein [Commensalibacter melissae]